MKSLVRVGLGTLLLCLAAIAQAADAPKPKVRAITAFVRLDPAHYQAQFDEALKVLKDAEAKFNAQGYEVQTRRVVTQPLGELVSGQSDTEALSLLQKIDQLAAEKNVMANVGPAMLHDSDDPKTMQLLAKMLSSLPHINASTIIADEQGIHWQTIQKTAAMIRYVADHSAHSQGNFQFTATAMLKPLGPFYPGTYHLGAGKQLSLGFEGALVVQQVFARTHGDAKRSVQELTEALSVHAKLAETIGNEVAAAHGWSFAGVDPTPAPLGDVSIGAAIETYNGAKFGESGTLGAAYIITSAVKAVTVKQIGYSGLMVPILEDKVLAQRWSEGVITTDALLAYSAVCGTGLDAVPYPGDISESQLTRILGDVATLAFKWNKPLSARLLPVKGKTAGEMTEFDSPYLFNTRLQR